MVTQDKNAIFHASIGEVVQAWRETRGLSVTALAQQSGPPITKGYISQLEHNKVRQPGDDHLVRIAAALDIPVLFLVNRRLPSELSSDELKEAEEDKGGFAFGAPLSSPQREHLDEDEELRQILAQLEELQSRVKKLIAQKGRL